MQAVILFLNVFASIQAIIDLRHETPEDRARLEQFVECLKNCVKEPAEDNQGAILFVVVFASTQAANFDLGHGAPKHRSSWLAEQEQNLECLKVCVDEPTKGNQVACNECGPTYSRNPVNLHRPNYPQNFANPGGPSYPQNFANLGGPTYSQNSVNLHRPNYPQNTAPNGPTYFGNAVNPNRPYGQSPVGSNKPNFIDGSIPEVGELDYPHRVENQQRKNKKEEIKEETQDSGSEEE
ncbi:unnamed protein product [Cylicocyclus nassatus]|uniref:Uncharacterized protein n=1 Tax=Cylicocyclus nassatus TaxID=53992 RepID=A0AA36GG06_CYLNA|nr:unnamed protein product [Cylicocyclus nassatus]